MRGKAYKKLLPRHNREAGQSLVEFALVLPLLLLLLLGIIQFGALFNGLIVLNAAAREGARVMAVEDDQEKAKATVADRCTSAPFLSCDEAEIVFDEVENMRVNVTVTVSGRVPLFLFVFSESELSLAGKAIMRLEPEIPEINEDP
jgi:Flp pilus assembly protein TadG